MNRKHSSAMTNRLRTSGWAFAIVAVALAAGTPAQAQYVSTNHVREAVRSGVAQQVGRLPQSQELSLDIVLPLRDQAALEDFLAEVYNPRSSSYRHFLTVPEFTEKFGPSVADYETVVKYAKSNGLTVTGGTRDGMEVQVKGPVSAVEKAFHVSMMSYQHPTENRTFFGPDREPTTSLGFSLWHVSGLDNYSIPHSLFVKKSDYATAHGIEAKAVISHATTGPAPRRHSWAATCVPPITEERH